MRAKLHLFDTDPETSESRLTGCAGCMKHSLEECFCEVDEDPEDYADSNEWDIPTKEYFMEEEWWDRLLGGEG